MKTNLFGRLAVIGCSLALISQLTPAALAANTFTDVPTTQWAYQAITDAANKGIAAGYSDGTFHPEGEVTYAQFSAFLARAFYNSPIDSTSSPWYKIYIDTLNADGILADTAISSGNTSPNMDKPINRYDMALMMYHIMVSNGDLQEGSGQQAKDKLSDWNAIPQKYADAVEACFNAGILSGMPDGSFSGSQPMNRAQACTVIARASGSAESGTSMPTQQPSQPSQTDVCTEVFNLINAERKKAGLNELKTLNSLTKAAQMRSVDLSQGHFEDRPDGSEWISVFETAGVTSDINIDYVDESIVGGTNVAAEVLGQIKGTPSALATLMDGEYTHVGIGYTHTSNGYQGYEDFWSILYVQPVGNSNNNNNTSIPGLPAPTPNGSPASFTPVPMANLANKTSLQKKATDEQLAQAYAEAVKLVTPYAGLSLEEQLQGIAYAVRQRFESGMNYSMESSHYNDPYGYFIEGSASCAGCTRATGLCLNILGIPYEHVNENQYDHQWCRVNVNGTYWICDAFGLYCGPEPAPYKHPYF